MRIEPVGPRPDDDLAGHRGTERRVDEEPTRPGGAGSRHLADERALVADDRRIEFKLAREAQRARHHPPGDERHDDPSAAGRGDRPARGRPDDQVVADERPVDIEGDEADGQDRVGGDDGHTRMMPDRRRGRWRRPQGSCPCRSDQRRTTRATRGRPARSGNTSQRHPGRRDATLITIASPWSAPISSSAAPSTASASGSRSSESTDHLEPICPTIEREGRLEGGGARQARHRVVPDVGQVRQDQVEPDCVGRLGRQQVRQSEFDPIRDRVTDGILAGELERVGRDVHREDLDRLERVQAPERDSERDRDRAAPRTDVRDPKRRRATTAARRSEPAHDLGLGEVDEQLGLGPRDEGPLVDLERQPVELLEPADVRHRLAGRAAFDVRLVAARGVGPDRRLGMGQHDRPSDPDRVSEQQLRVEPRRLRSSGDQARRALVQERPGRLDREPAQGTRLVRQRRHPRRVDPPGRP